MQIKALVFDVFGTVVDWRTSIIREVRAFGEGHGIAGDWAGFADRWREGYTSGMAHVNAGKDTWKKVDDIHRTRLDILLGELDLPGVPEHEIVELNRAWHRLDPWPDSVAGLSRLKSKFVIATLSNGNVSLLVDMAKFAQLPWDCVLSSELAGRYKPDHEVYRYAASILDLPCDRVMMVAAHSFDLVAASEAGLRTAFVSRPNEYGDPALADTPPAGAFDLLAGDFNDLASQLNCL